MVTYASKLNRSSGSKLEGHAGDFVDFEDSEWEPLKLEEILDDYKDEAQELHSQGLDIVSLTETILGEIASATKDHLATLQERANIEFDKLETILTPGFERVKKTQEEVAEQVKSAGNGAERKAEIDKTIDKIDAQIKALLLIRFPTIDETLAARAEALKSAEVISLQKEKKAGVKALKKDFKDVKEAVENLPDADSPEGANKVLVEEISKADLKEKGKELEGKLEEMGVKLGLGLKGSSTSTSAPDAPASTKVLDTSKSDFLSYLLSPFVAWVGEAVYGVIGEWEKVSKAKGIYEAYKKAAADAKNSDVKEIAKYATKKTFRAYVTKMSFFIISILDKALKVIGVFVPTVAPVALIGSVIKSLTTLAETLYRKAKGLWKYLTGRKGVERHKNAEALFNIACPDKEPQAEGQAEALGVLLRSEIFKGSTTDKLLKKVGEKITVAKKVLDDPLFMTDPSTEANLLKFLQEKKKDNRDKLVKKIAVSMQSF